jgi:hypothetical protein
VSVFWGAGHGSARVLGIEGKYMSTCPILVMLASPLGPRYHHKYSCRVKNKFALWVRECIWSDHLNFFGNPEI